MVSRAVLWLIMGVSLSNFVGEIFKSLPGIGQVNRAYETLASARPPFQQQDNSKGGLLLVLIQAGKSRLCFRVWLLAVNSSGGSSNSGGWIWRRRKRTGAGQQTESQQQQSAKLSMRRRLCVTGSSWCAR